MTPPASAQKRLRRNSTTHSSSTAGSGTTPGPLSHGGLGIVGGQGYTFSAKTCLELIPKMSDKQINAEVAILETLDLTVPEALSSKVTRSHNTIERKREVLQAMLRDTLSNQVNTIVNKYDSLAHSICRSLEEAEKKLEDTTQELNRLLADHQSRNELVEIQAPPPSVDTVPTNQPPEDPVRFSEISFADITMDTVRESFDFTQSLPGNRSSQYFGDIGYSYGPIKHEAAPYPESHPILDRIFSEISATDSSFTRENFSCLVQRYENGSSSINMHSDDERVIAPNSNIYTVSFGATRTARFYNVVGALQDRFFELNHGSVNIMTHSSQAIWKHVVIPAPDVTNDRISLTFRHMIHHDQSSASPPSQNQLPPIAQPIRPTRVLFLTDSIHASTPTHLFDDIPNTVCIKKKEYQLANIDLYHREFAYTDIVLISMGVNDLSRYGHSARTLLNTVSPLIQRYCRLYPQCKFVFNSVLLTRDYRWLNSEIEILNQAFFDMSMHYQNLSFLDTDRLASLICKRDASIIPYAQGPRGGLTDRSMRSEQSNNGIHLSFRLRRLLSAELVKSVGCLSGTVGSRFARCDWLKNFRTRSS